MTLIHNAWHELHADFARSMRRSRNDNDTSQSHGEYVTDEEKQRKIDI